MFKKKISKYSIRKLTVGAASVLIGMAFLNSNEAKADTGLMMPKIKQMLHKLQIRMLKLQAKI